MIIYISITANNRNSLELNSLPSVISDFQLAFMSYELTKLMQVNSTGKAIIPEMNIMILLRSYKIHHDALRQLGPVPTEYSGNGYRLILSVY